MNNLDYGIINNGKIIDSGNISTKESISYDNNYKRYTCINYEKEKKLSNYNKSIINKNLNNKNKLLNPEYLILKNEILKIKKDFKIFFKNSKFIKNNNFDLEFIISKNKNHINDINKEAIEFNKINCLFNRKKRLIKGLINDIY